MAYSNDSLIKAFVHGADSGKCNRMAIEDGPDGWTFLWGYGHALYAARMEDGPLFVYDGWYGYSQTTSTHLNALKGKAKSVYGAPREDGQAVRVVVDGEGTSEVTNSPPSGHALLIVDADPEASFGRLDAKGRPELSEVADAHVAAPHGYGD